MSLETDLLIDRRRLKRRLSIWRLAAVAAVFACGVILLGPYLPHDHVARLTVNGEITDTTAMVRALDRLRQDGSVKALIVSISSPGGGAGPSAALHDAIARVAETRPVVAVMGAVAASGGYMIAMPARRVFANAATLTGSIGVIAQLPEFSGLLDRIGVTAETITSGPLKDQPNPAKKLSDGGRTYLRALVADIADQFIDTVAKGRHMDPARVRELADGRAYTGRQAQGLGLIDAIGDETDARRWLETDAKLRHGLPIQELRTVGWQQQVIAETVAPALGALLKSVVYQGLALDGVKTLWQPSASE